MISSGSPGETSMTCAEKAGVRLGDAPLGRGRHHVGGQAQAAQDVAGPCGLIAGDADPQSHLAQPRQRRANVGIDVLIAVLLPDAAVLPALPFRGYVES